jgi:regulator of sigma E protease
VSLIWFILLIGGLITVHELGHFFAARLLDIRVLKVSIGLGPALLSTRRNGTEYAVSWVPLGGYVRLLGEDGEPVAPADRPHAFAARPAWQRLAVILAGPAANLLMPVLLFVHLYANQAVARSPTIGAVFAGQPAAEADLRPGDRVLAVDGEPIQTWDELNERVAASAGRELRITVERPGQERLTKYVTPREHRRTDAFGVPGRVGLIGVAPHFRLPQVGVEPDSPAWRAGLRTFDVILSLQGRPILTAAELEPLINPHGGAMVLVTFVRPDVGLGFASAARLEPHSAQIVPAAIARVDRPPRYDAGLRSADLFIHDVEAGSPAGKIGLQPGDVLVALDGAKLSAWELFTQALEERPDDLHSIDWRTADGGLRHAAFRLEPRRTLDEYQAESTLYVFGAAGARATEPVPEVALEPHLTAAVTQAVGRALSVTATLVHVLWLTALGRLPATALGGPILIYQVAGVAAQHGAEQFLVMAALVSLNLGLLNLLPVPLLDGGQASLVVLEAVRRRPVSVRARARATWVGVVVLLMMLLLASRNDLVRHFFR